MLSDITSAGVTAAMAEFDKIGRGEFLSKYGFGESRGYFLVAGGRQYDSKAICGAAHGYDVPSDGPLRASDFSGGEVRVRSKLQALGFLVTSPKDRGSGWTEEERTLALYLYRTAGLIGRGNPKAVALSAELNSRAFHPDAGTRPSFRNPNGVALKLANFASLDPQYAGAGMSSTSRGDRETWHKYAGDIELLTNAVAALRSGAAMPAPMTPSESVVPLQRPIERQLLRTYEVTGSQNSVEAQRREAELVERFAAWLRGRGHEVCSHHYPVLEPPLRNDLFDETERTLWEAKSSVGRSDIRMAVGQLLDYRRFEPSDVGLGVLLPWVPSDDLINYLQTIPTLLAWPRGDVGFEIRSIAT